MASTEREPIMGVWGRSPQRSQPLVMGQGAKPPEADSFLRIEQPITEGANWHNVRVLNEINCILLLDSNETGGLIVINVIWSHFLFGTSQKTTIGYNRRYVSQNERQSREGG